MLLGELTQWLLQLLMLVLVVILECYAPGLELCAPQFATSVGLDLRLTQRVSSLFPSFVNLSSAPVSASSQRLFKVDHLSNLISLITS